MRRKIIIYGVAIAAVISIWTAWWAQQPAASEIRATRTFIKVNAPADRVWQVLTDFQSYPQWNPYVVSVSGPLAEGATLHIDEHIGGRTHGHRVQIRRLDPVNRTLVWSGGLWPRVLLRWDEGFQIQPNDPTHCEVTITRAYQGWLLPLYWKMFNPYDLAAVRDLGAALKLRAQK